MYKSRMSILKGNIVDEYTIEYTYPVDLNVVGTVVRALKDQQDKNKTIIKLEESMDKLFIEEKFNNGVIDLTVRSKNPNAVMSSVSGSTANSIRIVSIADNVSPELLAAIFSKFNL